MNSNQEKEISNRMKEASKIVSHPEAYKVCESCDSIVTETTTLCPNCHGYCFNTEIEAVKKQAIHLSSNKQTSITVCDLN